MLTATHDLRDRQPGILGGWILNGYFFSCRRKTLLFNKRQGKINSDELLIIVKHVKSRLIFLYFLYHLFTNIWRIVEYIY